jgi:hypothetical protein
VGDRTDFYISHAGPDRAWAEWVAWQLDQAGYIVELDVWHWTARQNFIAATSNALDRCDWVLALFSQAYFDPGRYYTTLEWTTAMLPTPGLATGRLIAVRIEHVPSEQMPSILRPLVSRDLFGLTEDQARRALLDAVAWPRHPDREPALPRTSAADGPARSPGPIPRADQVVADEPGFPGRLPEESSAQEPAGHAFLSYMREDSDRVDGLQQALEAAGIRVWRDTADLWPGENWRTQIRSAITDSALVFIACFSSQSAARAVSYQNEELALAVEQLRLRQPDIPWLIPVRFDDCQVPDRELGGGRTLASIQRADLFGDHHERQMKRLVLSVQRLLGQHPTAEPTRSTWTAPPDQE